MKEFLKYSTLNRRLKNFELCALLIEMGKNAKVENEATSKPKQTNLAGLTKVVGIFKDAELFDEVEAFVEKVRKQDSQEEIESLPAK